MNTTTLAIVASFCLPMMAAAKDQGAGKATKAKGKAKPADVSAELADILKPADVPADIKETGVTDDITPNDFQALNNGQSDEGDNDGEGGDSDVSKPMGAIPASDAAKVTGKRGRPLGSVNAPRESTVANLEKRKAFLKARIADDTAEYNGLDAKIEQYRTFEAQQASKMLDRLGKTEDEKAKVIGSMASSLTAESAVAAATHGRTADDLMAMMAAMQAQLTAMQAPTPEAVAADASREVQEAAEAVS